MSTFLLETISAKQPLPSEFFNAVLFRIFLFQAKNSPFDALGKADKDRPDPV